MNQLGLAKPIIERLRSGNNLDLAKPNLAKQNNLIWRAIETLTSSPVV
jgi:hypothetical protein